MTFDDYRADLIQPQLGWKGDAPYSELFGDTYFSVEDGLAESRYVYLGLNQLPDAWRNRDSFTIGEIGFGTGLNFMATLDAWRREKGRCRRLHYIAYEIAPLPLEQISRAAGRWPELEPALRALASLYPPLMAGFHRAELYEDGVTLSLALGDCRRWLPETRAAFDAWYMDGFAPGRAPDLWNEEIFGMMARLSKPGTTLSTFSVSGMARRALVNAGFEVEKRPGTCSKRESLSARLPRAVSASVERPWFEIPQPRPIAGKAIVIGAGLAGSATAYALSRRGWEVEVLERAGAAGAGASGNDGGVVIPYISSSPGHMSRLYLAAFEAITRHLEWLTRSSAEPLWTRSGALQLPSSGRLESLMERLGEIGIPASLARMLDRDETRVVSGLELSSPSIFYSRAGWLPPRKLCELNLRLSGARVRYATEVAGLSSCEAGWRALSASGEAICEGDVVIIATAADARRFEQTAWLPLEPVKGQVAQLQATELSSRLKTVLCYDGYVLPADRGLHLLGATYEHRALDDSASLDRSEYLRLRLSRWSQELASAPLALGGARASFRASTHDRVPYIGPVPRYGEFLELYSELKKGYPPARYPAPPHHTGLFISAGHGSRGILSTQLGAELLASQICGEPAAGEAALADSLNPARFLVKKLLGALPRHVLREDGQSNYS